MPDVILSYRRQILLLNRVRAWGRWHPRPHPSIVNNIGSNADHDRNTPSRTGFEGIRPLKTGFHQFLSDI